jgi:hypothetical protein
MLSAYDSARQKAEIQEVQVFHGKVAEASFRKWLSEFLPKKYGVTSGYVISPGLKATDKAPHFDVIIYDQMASPILWIDENPDASPQGKSLAIPVEYVKIILEVKSSISNKTMSEALQHLNDLKQLMDGQDNPSIPYRLYLPPSFRCGLVFFELRSNEVRNKNLLPKLVEGFDLRGFIGGLILRGEGLNLPQSGRLELIQSNTEIAKDPLDTATTPLIEAGITKTIQIGDRLHIGAMLKWSESAFSQFAFDLVAMLEGTYDPGRISSFYGMGSSFAELMQGFWKA